MGVCVRTTQRQPDKQQRDRQADRQPYVCQGVGPGALHAFHCVNGQRAWADSTHVIGLKYTIEAGLLVRAHGSDHIHVTLVEKDFVVIWGFPDHVPDCTHARTYVGRSAAETSLGEGTFLIGGGQTNSRRR
jgi:hypothetical protein